MITLAHHVEYLSDAWMEAARRFLDAAVGQAKDRLAGRAFSVSERFIHAPPHLKFPGDVASWTVRYDGTSLTLDRDFDEGADMVVEGDYQAALTGAQCIGMLVPGAMAAMLREVATM